MAEVNAAYFRSNPKEHADYFRALENTLAAPRTRTPDPWRLVYAEEKDTCGKPNCWNTWRELCERARATGQPIAGDCKAFSAAHAAASLIQSPDREWFVGLRIGCFVGHAVAGVRVGADIEAIDVCLAAGMEPLPRYDGFNWEKVRLRC